MIEQLSNYAFSLVIAIFILNIVQMLLPENKNRKYVLFVATMIVTIILIEPIINITDKDIEVANILEESTHNLLKISEENTNKYYEQQVLNQYKLNIENSIVERLEQMGYETKFIKCEYNEKTFEPEYLYLELMHNDGEVVPVKIEVMSNLEQSSDEFRIIEKVKIKETLTKEYGIKNVEVKKWTK